MPTLRSLRLLQSIEQKNLNSTQLETLLSGSLTRQSDLPLLFQSTTAKTRIMAAETFPTIAASASAVTGLGSFTTSAAAIAASATCMTSIAANSASNTALAASSPGASICVNNTNRANFVATIGAQTQASGLQSPWAKNWRFGNVGAFTGASGSQQALVNNGSTLISGSTTSEYFTSNDGGVTWTRTATGSAMSGVQNSAWAQSYGIAMPSGGSTATYYTSGAGWTAGATTPASVTSTGFSKLVYHNSGYYVAVCQSTSAHTQAIYIASNPTSGTYTASTLPSSVAWRDIAVNAGRVVAIAYNSASTAVSTNGTTWSAGTSLPASKSWYSIDAGTGSDAGKMMVGNASDSSLAFTSDSGVTWSTVTATGMPNVYKVVYHNNTRSWWVFSSGTKTGVSTDDGATWTVFDQSNVGYSHNFAAAGPYLCAMSGNTVRSAY